MKEILITAFEPFGGDKINPTEMILDRLSPLAVIMLGPAELHSTFNDMYEGIVASICGSLTVVIP